MSIASLHPMLLILVGLDVTRNPSLSTVLMVAALVVLPAGIALMIARSRRVRGRVPALVFDRES
ncbi:MAG: hypothetical protein ACRDGM_08735 [bacterium]